MHNTYDKLLFFSVSKVLSLYDILTVFSDEEMIQEVGFLFENDPKAIKKLKTAVKVIGCSEITPLVIVTLLRSLNIIRIIHSCMNICLC